MNRKPGPLVLLKRYFNAAIATIVSRVKTDLVKKNIVILKISFPTLEKHTVDQVISYGFGNLLGMYRWSVLLTSVYDQMMILSNEFNHLDRRPLNAISTFHMRIHGCAFIDARRCVKLNTKSQEIYFGHFKQHLHRQWNNVKNKNFVCRDC